MQNGKRTSIQSNIYKQERKINEGKKKKGQAISRRSLKTRIRKRVRNHVLLEVLNTCRTDEEIH